MGRGRSLFEHCIANFLMDNAGFIQPTLRIQSLIFPGVTPALSNRGADGRAAAVIDMEKKIKDASFDVSLICGLKAKKKRHTTFDITTGRGDSHIQAVFDAAENGLDIPIVLIAMNGIVEGKGPDAHFASHGKISATSIKVGKIIRSMGGRDSIPRRTVGQGKGRGNAAPIAWGFKNQTSKAGKTYTYVSLQANVKACQSIWHTFDNLEQLSHFIEESCEKIFL